MEFRIIINDNDITRNMFPYKVQYRDWEDRVRNWTLLKLCINIREAQQYINELKKNKIGEIQ